MLPATLVMRLCILLKSCSCAAAMTADRITPKQNAANLCISLPFLLKPKLPLPKPTRFTHDEQAAEAACVLARRRRAEQISPGRKPWVGVPFENEAALAAETVVASEQLQQLAPVRAIQLESLRRLP